MDIFEYLTPGVITSLIATFILWICRNTIKFYKIYNFKGLWLQHRIYENKVDDQVSVLELKMSILTGKYSLSGMVLLKNGDIECRWSSAFCSINKNQNHILYFYDGNKDDTPFLGHQGFGIIILEKDGKHTIMDRGYFLDASSESMATPTKYSKIQSTNLGYTPTTIQDFLKFREEYIVLILEHRKRLEIYKKSANSVETTK